MGWFEQRKQDGFVDEKRRPLISLMPPVAGMFIWFRVYIEELDGLDHSGDPQLNTAEKRLWDKFAREGVLIAPGFFFVTDDNDERIKTTANFRMSFSNADVSDWSHCWLYIRSTNGTSMTP